MKKKVLLFLYGPLSNSGVPNVLLTIVKNLSQKVDFTIMSLKGGVLDDEFKKCGAKIEYLYETRPTSKWSRRFYDYVFRYNNIAKQLNAFLKSNNFDVIHSCSGFDGGLFMKVAKKRGVPIRILHCHGKFPNKAHNILKQLQVNKYKKLIERYVTIKLTCSKEAGKTYFTSTNNMITLVNPIDIDFYSNTVKTIDNSIRILQIGIFNENKNQLFSLDLFKQLLNQGISVKMSLIGYNVNSVYGKKMTNYILKNNLNDKVEILPHNIDKREVFANTDVLLLPSYTEACPLVTLEAQASNIPVIVSTNVPNDVDFGLVEFISLDNKEEWLNSIKNIKSKEFILNEDFIDLTPSNYGEQIYKLYKGELTNE